MADSPGWRVALMGPSPVVPVSDMRKQTLMLSAVTPFEVAPPLSPTKTVAHGGEYTDSIWRTGLP